MKKSALLFLGVLLVATLQAGAPKRSFFGIDDINLSVFNGTDGFGWRYVPSASFRFGERAILWGGPVVHGIDRNIGGYLVGAKCRFIEEDRRQKGHLHLDAGLSFERCTGSPLSERVIENENKHLYHGEATAIDFSTIKFKGWEVAATGIFSYRFNFGLKLQGEAGLMYYSTKESNSEPVPTFRDKSDFGVRIGGGLGWSF